MKNSEERQFSMEQFVGIFPNAISDKMCSDFVEWYNEMKEHGITMSSMEDFSGEKNPIDRKDEVIHIPSGLPMYCFPKGLTRPLWQNLSDCYRIYYNEYDIDRAMTSYAYNVRRVQVSGGFHTWHHEHSFIDPLRVLAWHLTIEAPKRGGETEFLYQSMRIEPKVGQLAIWPAGFTHKHRGNPPLEGQKTYLTGWFELINDLEMVT